LNASHIFRIWNRHKSRPSVISINRRVNMHYKKLKNCGMIFVSLRATSMRNRNIKNMVVAGKHDISWNILRSVCSYVAKTLSLGGGGGGGVSRSKLPHFLNSLFTLPKSNFWNLVWFSHEYIQSAGVSFRERIYQGHVIIYGVKWWHRREKTGKTVNLDPRVHPFTRTFKHVDPGIEVGERLGKWKTK
jgi:hypothetical protein